MTSLLFKIKYSFIACIFLMLIPATAVFATTTVTCPFDPTSNGDFTDRGFYVQNYSASSLGLVTLQYSASGTAGLYTIQLQARSGTYDGPIVGTASATATLPIGATLTPMTFNFGNAPVTVGATLTFIQTVTAPVSGSAYYNTGIGPCTNVTETEGTTPPLDTFRRNSMGVTITDTGPALPVATAALPALSSASLLLLGLLLAGLRYGFCASVWSEKRRQILRRGI